MIAGCASIADCCTGLPWCLGAVREQTAVAVGAQRHTFHTNSSSGSGSKVLASAFNSAAGGGPSLSRALTLSKAPSTAAASPDSGPSAAASSSLLASGAAAVAAADPRSQCVLLVLSAQDYGAALEGRLTSLLEEKVCAQTT